jgi:hypothetical protein
MRLYRPHSVYITLDKIAQAKLVRLPHKRQNSFVEGPHQMSRKKAFTERSVSLPSGAVFPLKNSRALPGFHDFS